MSRSMIYDGNKNLAECDTWAAELIIKLRVDNTALRADKERLDWADLHLGDFQRKDGSFLFPDHPQPIRAAIDAALANNADQRRSPE